MFYYFFAERCLYDGEYYPIHQKVHVGMMSPWRGEDVIFDEKCQMQILPREKVPLQKKVDFGPIFIGGGK